MISPFDNLIWQAVDSFGTPLGMTREQWFALVNSIIQKESSFNPAAISYTGDGIGLMQVNPAIWIEPFGLSREQLFDPWTNIQTGVQIAKDYIVRYGTSGGLGAYFAGPASRLTYAAQSYARAVLSIYSAILSRVRGLFSVTVRAGQSYFLPQEPNGTDPSMYFNTLPEQGTEITTEIPTEVSADTTWLWIVGGGVALALWATR